MCDTLVSACLVRWILAELAGFVSLIDDFFVVDRNDRADSKCDRYDN